MKRKLLVSILPVLILAASVSLYAPARALGGGLSASLVGSWVVHATPQTPPGGPAAPPPFVSLFSFETGGTLSELNSGIDTSSLVVAFPALEGAHATGSKGAWKRTGGNRYEGRFVTLLASDAGPVGFVVSTFVARIGLKDTLLLRSESDIILGTDVDGEPILSGAVTLVEGTRIEP